MLILVASLALPLAVAAQPASEDGAAAKLSELVDQTRQATTASEIVVTGCAMPADSEAYDTRADRRTANQEFDAPPYRAKRTEESPGTREFILHNIVDFRAGTADFDHMTSTIGHITQANLPVEKRWIMCRGAFRDINFLHVSQDGFDDFEVVFSGAAIEWEVAPFNTHQKTDHWAARFYYPEPMTGQFDGFLRSMEAARPDYARLAPGFRTSFEAQWPSLHASLSDRRGPRSMVFLRRGDDGSYAYKVAYGKHAAIWRVAPLDAAGKITGLTYEEGA